MNHPQLNLFDQPPVINTSSPINVDKLNAQNMALAKYLLAGNSINMTETNKLKMLGIGTLHSRIAEIRKFFKEYGIELLGPRVNIGGVICCDYRLRVEDVRRG